MGGINPEDVPPPVGSERVSVIDIIKRSLRSLRIEEKKKGEELDYSKQRVVQHEEELAKLKRDIQEHEEALTALEDLLSFKGKEHSADKK